jgi:hypothetical protein
MKYLLITVSLLFASQTMAQEKKKSERAQPAPSSTAVVSLQQDFMTADINSDGGISLAELESMKENYEDFDVEKTFKLLDKDGNGIISSEEFQGSTQALRKRPGKVNVRR